MHGSKLLGQSEIEMIEHLCQLLEPCQEFTTAISGKSYSTISIVLPYLTRLLEIFGQFKCKNKSITKLARNFFDDLTDRSQVFFDHTLVITATFLDHRFKKFKFVKDQSQRELFLKKAKSHITQFCTSLAETKKRNAVVMTGNCAKRTRVDMVNVTKHFNMACEDSDTDDDDEREARESSNDIQQAIERELEFYLRARVDTNDTEETKFSPLTFFKDNQLVLPHLCQVAKAVFCIPVSSVPSEQLFSHVADIITEKRNRLLPELAETLTLIAENAHLPL